MLLKGNSLQICVQVAVMIPVRIIPKIQMTLEECMEYIQQDECIEVTPKNIRLRKTILDEDTRKKFQKMLKTEEVS